jgi:cyanophycinase
MKSQKPKMIVVLGIILLLNISVPRANAQTNQANSAGLPLNIEATGKATSDAMPVSSTAEPIRPFDPAGKLVLVGGGEVTTEIRKLISKAGQAGQPKSCLVIMTTSSSYADTEPPIFWTEPWLDQGFESIEILHTRDRAKADTLEFNEPLQRATAVWVTGGDQARFTEAYMGTKTEAMLQNVVARGGVVSGTSAGAAMASKVMIADGQVDPVISVGLDLLPYAIVDQHFANRDRFTRLKKAVALHPSRVGIGIDESTAAVFHGRSMAVVGEGNVHLVFPQTEFASEETKTIKPGTQWLDWTTEVRASRERTLPPFPNPDTSVPPAKPIVEKGALLMVGGGEISPEIWNLFMAKAGGAKARIVVVPTVLSKASKEPLGGTLPNFGEEAAMFRKLGAEKVTVLSERDSKEDGSNENLSAIESATGIWFGGGRQWNFVDNLEATEELQAIRACLARGGIIGGSSAGASIQGELLIRGAPVGNQIMVQDGYRRGFGFLPGTGIDQHFSQRNRSKDLSGVVARFPGILGIGIDEGTAMIVERSKGSVLGSGQIFLYKSDQPTPASGNADPSSVVAKPGQVIDLISLEFVSN